MPGGYAISWFMERHLRPTAPQPLIDGLTGANVKVTLEVANNFPVGVRVGIVNYGMPTPAGQVTLTDKPQTQFPYFGRVAMP